MKFGKVASPENIDFTLPPDHPDTARSLAGNTKKFRFYTGCTKWSKAGLPGFFPPGTDNELAYYSTQFNGIEFNASFYRIFKPEQYLQWRQSVGDGFLFFPKVEQSISHLRRLNPEGLARLEPFLEATRLLGDKLGTCFLQLHPSFKNSYLDRVLGFIEKWPDDLSLAIEFRHSSWYSEMGLQQEIAAALKERQIAHILTDTPGRRDLLHMQLTSPEAFIRFVAANHETDRLRLKEWVSRIKTWQQSGLAQLNFFIHQAMKRDTPLLASYFIDELNAALETDFKIPKKHHEIQ